MGKLAFETNDIKILEEKIEKGYYYLPTTYYKEVVGFLIGMLQYNSDIRLSAEELSRHPFLNKNIRYFERINIKEMKQYIKNDQLELGIYEDKYLWNLFNVKYGRYLEIIPEDSDVSESIFFNKTIQKKNTISKIHNNNNNNYSYNFSMFNKSSSYFNNNQFQKNSDEFKIKLKKAFEKINEDFLIMQPVFIPLLPGNDPKDLLNEEKQI